MTRMKILLSLLAVSLAGLAVQASTSVSSTKIRCAMANVFYGRSDGMCHDAANKGPLGVVNGSAEWAFPSSLYVNVREDFLGYFIIPDVDTDDAAQTGPWNTQDAGTAGCPARKADADDGQIELLLDNGNEVGDCTLYWGDEQNIDSDTGPVCIFRVALEAQGASTDKFFWGLGDARNAILESMNAFAGFSVTGADLNLDTESDDNSTDVAPIDSGAITILAASTFYEYMVCLNAMCGGSPTNVKFFYRATLGGDWTAVNTATTFSVGADVQLQPIIQVEKTSSTNTPGMLVDYVDCYWKRS